MSKSRACALSYSTHTAEHARVAEHPTGSKPSSTTFSGKALALAATSRVDISMFGCSDEIIDLGDW